MTVSATYVRLFLLIALLSGSLRLFSPRPCCARQQAPNSPDFLTGETLYYTINFWLLSRSAAGELCFTKTPDGYRAYFEADTRGMLRFLAGDRKETMESIMDYDEARQRLRPRMFRETFTNKKKVFTRTILFNYERGTFTCTRNYPWGRPRTTKAELPDTEFEDMLTLYYNLRMGCYGPLPADKKLRVPVIMKERPSFITLTFPPAESKKNMRGFSAILAMQRNITHAFSKRVLIRLSPEAILEKALVEDAYFFGDLEVQLTGINYN